MKKIEYYLMRHANYYDIENQFVSYWGMLALKKSVDKLKSELEDKFPNKKLRIIHSILPRAKHTALLMGDMLIGVRLFFRSDPRLNSNKFLISREYVEKLVSSCDEDEEICLILSHKPDIKYFYKKDLEPSQYVCVDIEIDESQNKNEQEEEELPF